MFLRQSWRPCAAIIAMAVLVSLVGGCTRPIVKPTPSGPPPQPGFTGIPPQGQVAEQELQGVQTNLRVVYFEFDKYSLNAEARASLEHNAQMLKMSPHVKIIAEGHCDERGTDEYNLALGERRARSVVDFLVSLGIPAQNFSTVSYGSELPVDPAHNEAAWAKNRRVFLRVTR